MINLTSNGKTDNALGIFQVVTNDAGDCNPIDY